MYSKNDYRYYLENQLMHSDDFLAHYGVKGMKWRHHARNLVDEQLAKRATKLGYGGTYFATSGDKLVTINKNNKDLASNYLNDRGRTLKKKADRRIKKIRNKRVKRAAQRAVNAAHKSYQNNVVAKAEKRAYDSHNIEIRNGRLVAKKGKKIK